MAVNNRLFSQRNEDELVGEAYGSKLEQNNSTSGSKLKQNNSTRQDDIITEYTFEEIEELANAAHGQNTYGSVGGNPQTPGMTSIPDKGDGFNDDPYSYANANDWFNAFLYYMEDSPEKDYLSKISEGQKQRLYDLQKRKMAIARKERLEQSEIQRKVDNVIFIPTIDATYEDIDENLYPDQYAEAKYDWEKSKMEEARAIAALSYGDELFNAAKKAWKKSNGNTWNSLTPEQQKQYALNYKQSAMNFIDISVNGSTNNTSTEDGDDGEGGDEIEDGDDGEDGDDSEGGDDSEIDTSLTPAQEEIINKAYAIAQQNALDTKQGTISQAYDEYRRATNPYGSVAENLAANGLSQNGGYSKYLGGQKFNAYSNTVNSANKAYENTMGDLDLSKAESTLAYQETNRANAATEAANAETKKTNALNILAYYVPEYNANGTLTDACKEQITTFLREAGYTESEIEIYISKYRNQE